MNIDPSLEPVYDTVLKRNAGEAETTRPSWRCSPA